MSKHMSPLPASNTGRKAVVFLLAAFAFWLLIKDPNGAAAAVTAVVRFISTAADSVSTFFAAL